MGFKDLFGLVPKRRRARTKAPKAAAQVIGPAAKAPASAPKPPPKTTVTLATALKKDRSQPAAQGQYCVIGEGVEFGDGVRLGHHVVIHARTRIGNFVSVGDGAVLGWQPIKAARSLTTSAEPLPPAYIGDEVRIGPHATVYAGATIGPRVFVADGATVRERVTIGEATIVGRGAVVENQSTVGARCKLETNAYITAYSELGDDVFVAPGVLTSNDNYTGRDPERVKHFKGVTVKRGGRLGVGSIILPGKTVAEDSLVAAGAVVTRDTEPEMVHYGVPAKPFRKVDEKQLLRNQ